MLYIIATPIGNLKDISFRAIEILKACDVVYCEDTRLSKRLMQAYEIDTPLKSYHKFNEQKLSSTLIDMLKEGKDIALISDAGTPLINDPGAILVKKVHEAGLDVTHVPGASAPLTALVLSGLAEKPFQFIGFFEKKQGGLVKQLSDLSLYNGVTVGFVSPHQLIATLKAFDKALPDHTLFIAREMTKKFEETIWGRPKELIEKWSQTAIKGEFVLVVPEVKDEVALDPTAWIEHLQMHFGLTKKEALVVAAKHLAVDKRQLYNKLHQHRH